VTQTEADLSGHSGHRDISLDELAIIQPGLARIMPEVGARMWKCYYAAKAENWVLANFQLKEAKGLMELGAFTRPKYAEHLETFMNDDLGKVVKAIAAKDFAAFDQAFREAVAAGNAYHDQWDKGFIVWKIPDMPPPDLDLTPRR
jgi:hypothetical protein